jgi:hypothetical protein
MTRDDDEGDLWTAFILFASGLFAGLALATGWA